ncbi:MAG: hypothetical protein Q4G70_10800 [Pseudomonadota bacterium]|nr:hypothetical protein [Pseudomonadota bacterium]
MTNGAFVICHAASAAVICHRLERKTAITPFLFQDNNGRYLGAGRDLSLRMDAAWIPAFAGMTGDELML